VREVLRAGIAAGLLSGVPSGTGYVLGRGPDPVEATREIGRRACGRPSLLAGGAAHLALSCLFAQPTKHVARQRLWPLLAVAYGAGLYTVNFRLLAPRLWPEVRRYDGPFQLADHVAFALIATCSFRCLAPK